jgi:superfamily II DNA helicase RecQ
LTSRPAKRERAEVGGTDKALIGLQRIYKDLNAKPWSEGQAAALQLVHNASANVPQIIVLPTSSGKSALFFSRAAMAEGQTVIVVVPFAALVDDIIARGQAAGLQCEEWIDEKSGHELRQLIVVSADRAVHGEFLHFAKGLELSGTLAHVFFDECHVAFTDTSYRERLRELWMLRYLDCPFTGLTATLMGALEDVLRDRLSIPNAIIFRRSTARRTIQYQVIDSGKNLLSEVALQFIQQLQLPLGKKGVIYVRSYAIGQILSEALGCSFYMAKAEDKAGTLQEWSEGAGGWIAATGALGTGINIIGITHVVHVGRPYGLTSFVQQSGRGGRDGEISNSIIILGVAWTRGWRRKEALSAYSVERIDEDAMTAFIQTRSCRREVLSGYFDKETGSVDCSSTDSVFCDRCRESNKLKTQARQEEQGLSGRQAIAQKLKAVGESTEVMIKVMDHLQGQCIYCTLVNEGGTIGENSLPREESEGQLHIYKNCLDASAAGCGFEKYKKWRKRVEFGKAKHCWKCGLSQRICRQLERLQEDQQQLCEYDDIMLPSIFVLWQQQHLQKIVKAVGFQGNYNSNDLWEWLSGIAEGFGSYWSSNWMETWSMICETYLVIAREGNEGWAL